MNTDFYSFLAQGQSFRVHRLLPSTHAHEESDEKKRQAGVNKYRAQKIAFNTHARGDSGLVGDALIQTDRQSTFRRIWPKITYGPTFMTIKLCTKFYPSSYSSF
ncbi:hypothetical protein AVEN_80318-1 [Araneus ventricosus]|uniref:Uncharacterized protein n=1 Tax=Araneus ventricosus TaxID=182803 RepID=A0A4Y2IGB8_ARAVE|nr:hypothetical protein AVEN_80318-1 [Araneus ventricosus]